MNIKQIIIVVISTIIICMFLIAIFNTIRFILDGKGFKPVNENISDNHYIKKNKIYFVPNGNFYSQGAREILNADTKTFKVLTSGTSKDKNHVYIQQNIWEGIDPKTLKSIGKYFLQDNTSIYYIFEKIKDVDLKSFQIINTEFSKDENNVYYKNFKVLNIKPNKFTYNSSIKIEQISSEEVNIK